MKDAPTKIIKGSRESDERILEWLYLRDKGVSPNTIGRMFGVDHKTVREICERVDAESLD